MTNLKCTPLELGNPAGILPYEYLAKIPKIKVMLGVAFCQTHPAGIQKLIDIGAEVRIAREDRLFHSKIYIFSKGDKKSVFIGSSNFTYQGFFNNIEANILIEGSSTDEKIQYFEKQLLNLRSELSSFKPTAVWLKKYTEQYQNRRQKIKKAGIKDEVELDEEHAEKSGWLMNADWVTYSKRVAEGLKLHAEKYNEDLSYKLMVFNTASNRLKLPWKIDYFIDLENRKIIGGMRPYGFLGHVAASGKFRSLLAKGSTSQYQTIVKAINTISTLQKPLNEKILREQLVDLVSLGPSMKVWGRILALVRPDLFCTISSPRVRKLIASVLEISEGKIGDIDGYIAMIKLIHETPWFNSAMPDGKLDIEIWQRRVAFMDVVFYE